MTLEQIYLHCLLHCHCLFTILCKKAMEKGQRQLDINDPPRLTKSSVGFFLCRGPWFPFCRTFTLENFQIKYFPALLISSVQFSSVAHSCLTLCNPMNHSTPGLPVHHQLPQLTQTHVHWVGDTIQPSHPLSSPSPLPSIFPSIRVFSNESALRIRWPKYWSLSFNISPSNEHPGLISFGMDWLALLPAQGTLKSLLQHHSSKASILWHSAFFIVQLSHPYMTTGKIIALTRWTFVGKVRSLLFNMLSYESWS